MKCSINHFTELFTRHLIERFPKFYITMERNIDLIKIQPYHSKNRKTLKMKVLVIRLVEKFELIISRDNSIN